ncbi:MAG: hypothetical protein ACYTAF_14160, partial [Planctomycetota bacterium]
IGIAAAAAVARPAYADMFSDIRFQHHPPFREVDDAEAREILRENIILRMDRVEEEAGPAKPDALGRSAFERIEEKWSGKVHVYADLVTEEHDLWLRVLMSEFAYVRQTGAVKLGGAWGLTALMNEIEERAPDAPTEMTRKLTSGRDIRNLVFASFEEFHRHSTWIILRDVFREDTEGDYTTPYA